MKINTSINARCQLAVEQVDTIALPENKINVRLLIQNQPNSDFYKNPTKEAIIFKVHEVNIPEDPNGVYLYKLPKDGWYVYYQFNTIIHEFTTENIGFYYDPVNKTFMYNDIKVKNEDIINYIDSSNVDDCIIEDIFSICKLRNCLLKLQKKYICKHIQNCHEVICDDEDQLRTYRDFLFVSVYMLENLICQQRYIEALTILSKISTCNPICEELDTTSTSNPVNDCNCN